MPITNPIICAIDAHDFSRAQALATLLAPHVGAIKLGLEFFVAHGPQGISALSALGAPVFLDLKFHDIPNTAAAAARAACGLGVWMMTLHASGGARMLRAVREAVDDECRARKITPPLLMGVTVLTSMEAEELAALGVSHALSDHAVRLAQIARDSGMDGVICSAHEIRAIVHACGAEFLTVVPGIRPAHSATQDQRRVMTPKQAIAEGAHYLVIGRPITGSPDPVDAARRMFEA